MEATMHARLLAGLLVCFAPLLAGCLSSSHVFDLITFTPATVPDGSTRASFEVTTTTVMFLSGKG
jgi:hypothetical protein